VKANGNLFLIVTEPIGGGEENSTAKLCWQSVWNHCFSLCLLILGFPPITVATGIPPIHRIALEDCTMSARPVLSILAVFFATALSHADELPKVKNVEQQPLAAQAKRVAEALAFLGVPLTDTDRQTLAAATDVVAIQEVLDKHCLAAVKVTGEKSPQLETLAGPAKPELAEQGWRVFLVKVLNPDGVRGLELRADSPNAMPMVARSSGRPDPKVQSVGEVVGKRFLDLQMFNSQPLVRELSGLEAEYRILQIYSRDAGNKEANLGFSLIRNGKSAVASSKPVTIQFTGEPAVLVKLHVTDDDGASTRDGRPIMATFNFRDAQGRVYPAQTRRLAPDFFFHSQIYRGDGETVLLQPGKYTVSYSRGPEYLVLQKEITVPRASTHTEAFALKRWVHPAKSGWWSGDHHIHAAGCAHYESPTEGVTPEDMMRHVLGEDLNVGCCLSWGPCWYHQKRYFEGRVHPLSTANHLLRYDVEVSGFPSSHCGHICLLRLREQDYVWPDKHVAKVIEDWPSWDLPIFRWAKAQGGVVGFAHSGWGLQPVDDKDPSRNVIPNYLLPLMNGIGANEYLVDIAHDACDFISTVDTPSVWELNIWYHTLNCGYRCRISGETDFPCIYGERVGLGRSYVHLDGKLDFDTWAEGIKDGRCYVSDGKSHLMDFTVNDTGVGLHKSEVKLAEPGTVKVKARVAALLEPNPTEATERIRKAPLTDKPYWDVERARIDSSRKVPVDVVVNGEAVDRKEITADGSEQTVEFAVPIQKSSWVCLRIFPTSHTNPVFVLVGDKPIRASKKSADWCLKAIDKCWEQKAPNILGKTGSERGKRELAEARAAYDQAKEEYKKRLAECEE
jgi:hypothetical protein